MTAEAAVDRIQPGNHLVHGVTVAEPPALLTAMAERARQGDLKGVHVWSFNPQQYAAASYLQPELVDCFYPKAWFLGPGARNLANVGLVQFIPSYLHQVPRFLREQMTIDVCMTTVSPMDRAGYFSFGTANDLTSTAARQAKTLIIEVNEHMPRVFGDSLLHIDEVDCIVENHRPLMDLPPPPPRPEDAIVGQRIAEVIPDGGVLQLGIGGLPNAICPFLVDHRDLGIHSELFGPGMKDLIVKGVITGRRKTLHRGQHVFAVSYGTADTYRFMNDNPAMTSYPSDYVMDPCIVAKNDRMIAVNSIIQVDLTGQCNAESMGHFMYSGTGGQLDFVRGAYASQDGKAIMAFYSTAKDGEISRVVDLLDAGATVTTPRMDVQYLCSEHGLVNIKNKSVGERARLIISLAHPKFREDLERKAQEMRLY